MATLYRDLINNDELLNTYFDTTEVDDVVIRAEARFVTKRSDDNFDIGANPSAEGEDEDAGVDATAAVQVLDVVDNFGLTKNEAIGDKKTFGIVLMDYLKNLKEIQKERGMDDEEIAKRAKDIKTYASKVVGAKFKEFEFYTGKSTENPGMVIMLHWTNNDAGDEIPVFYIWKYGTKGEKI